MTFTPKSIMGKRYAERLLPWLTEDHARFADAAGQPFQPVLEVAEEEGTQGNPGWVPGWGKLLNPETCPVKLLPYLAMYVGVQIPVTANEANARELVKAQAGRQRGTLEAIEGELRRTLKGELTTKETNLVLNPSFEYGLAAVNTAHCVAATFAQSAINPAIGRYCLAITTATTAFEGAGVLLGATPAGTYTAQARVRGPIGTKLELFTDNAADEASGVHTVTLTNEWQTVTWTWTTTATSTSPVIVARKPAAVAATYYLDAAMVYPGTEPKPYTDGDTVGNGWGGPAGDSITYQRGPVSFIVIERRNPKGEEDAYQMVISVVGTHIATWEEAEGNWESPGTWENESPIAEAKTAVNKVKPVIRINWLISEGATWFEDEGTWEETKGTWAESVLPGGKL